MRVRGQAEFGWDLMRSTVLSADAGFFSKDPYSMSFGRGTVTLAYRPIPFDGTLTATKVLLSMGFGGEGIGGGGKVIEPVPGVPPLCVDPDVLCLDPPVCPDDQPECLGGPVLKPDPTAGFDGLPETEVLDRTTGSWLRLPHLVSGQTYELKDPARYVDPATGTIQVRLVNEHQESVGISFNVVIHGEVE
jgi:hypothetical protein